MVTSLHKGHFLHPTGQHIYKVLYYLPMALETNHLARATLEKILGQGAPLL